MRKWAIGALAGVLALTACTVDALDDPGIGEGALTTIVYAADGSVLTEWHTEENRTLVTYDRLPRHLMDAVVAIEDERFWSHTGVDLQAIARALAVNVSAGEIVQGGSTITQQYLKNVLLTPETTVDRKLEEAVLALRLEEGLEKTAILERYLNTVYFGNGAYGVGTAADIYFGKDVRELTLAESALLAGLIKAPSASDPYDGEERALERRRLVLQKMLELGWVSAEDAAAANDEPLRLQPRAVGGTARFPYFVAEVQRRLLQDEALGATATDRYNSLYKGGLRIHTTIDPLVQQAAEAAVADVLPEDGPSGAMAAVDPRTGHVLALVGGRDFYSPDDPVAQFNLATQGQRQPGSAFKPFVLAAALESGISLDEVIEAGQTVTIETDSGPWAVENYNGSVFPDLTLSEATVFSVNVVYARLVDRVGPARVANLAAAAGITAELQPYHAIALGAQEVSVLDMASGYGTFAAGGIHVDPVFVTSIEDHESVNVYEAVPAVSTVVDRTVADQVTAALSEVVKRGTGQQARIGRAIAGKTGTSQDHVDAWFVGYTPEMVAAVWVGFPQEARPMEYPATPFSITGGTWPANIWSRFASSALSGVPYGEVATLEDPGVITVEVDVSTGFLAGPLCPRQHVQRLRMPADAAPTVVCPIHNPDGIVQVGAGVAPDLIGTDLATAIETLTAAGYYNTIEWGQGGPLAQGTVYGQHPPPGTAAQTGTVVRLLVAGPEPGTVIPLLIGLPVQLATDRLREAGLGHQVLTLAESDAADAANRQGLVWKQEPAAGTPIGELITLWANP